MFVKPQVSKLFAVESPMNSTDSSHFHRSLRAPRELLRDPALWAWLLVALLAILPARAALAG